MEKLKEWTGSGIVGGVAFAAFTMVVSWLTGSWEVVWVFVKLHFWESLSCALVALGAGIVIGLAIRGHIDKKKLDARDVEITGFEEEKAELSKFRERFHDLGIEDMSLVARVYLGAGLGVAPKENEVTRVENGVAIKGFLEFNKQGGVLQLRDGVRGKLDKLGDLMSISVERLGKSELEDMKIRAEDAETKLADTEAKLTEYEDEDRRLREKVRGMPRAFMLALGHAVEMGDIFEVMGNSDLERELEEIESQYGFVKCRKVWGNCKEWVATEQGRRAWNLAGGDDLYDPSSEELTRIRMCVLRTRECAIASLSTLETQVLMYLYDVPGAKCMHATAEKVTDSLGSWAVETKIIDDGREIESCALTEDAREIVEALAMDKAEKRLYKRTFGWKGEMFLDKLAENLDPGWKRLGDF